MLGWVLRIAIALGAALLIYLIGAAILRKFLISPEEEPPEPADLVPVDLEYRCTVCGATVVMTAAPGEDPEPPRHCREEMVRLD